MLITVLGSGYVGLVTAAGFAQMGNHVRCVDIDAARVDALQHGKVPFFEPGLSEVVARSVRGQRLSFSTQITGEYTASNFYFVAVGTPPTPDGACDLRAVFAASATIAKTATANAVLAIKSTVPVGTGDAVEASLEPAVRDRLKVASNPEFLKEGAALEDFFKPDRVIIGVEDPVADQALRELYRPLQLSSERVLVMRRRSAELAKYAANAILAVRISFMNEMSQLCDRVGADIHSIRRAIGSDRRIGPHFLYAGPGYGGFCFPKDVAALSTLARQSGSGLRLVEAASQANESQRAYIFEKVVSLFPDGLAGKTIALWGLAFKPETDDVRESPAGVLALRLMAQGAAIHGHDPEAHATFARSYAPEGRFFDDEYDAVAGADALVVMTEWRQYRNPDFNALKTKMRSPKIVDARNIWSTFALNERGFEYLGIGTEAGRRS